MFAVRAASQPASRPGRGCGRAGGRPALGAQRPALLGSATAAAGGAAPWCGRGATPPAPREAGACPGLSRGEPAGEGKARGGGSLRWRRPPLSAAAPRPPPHPQVPRGLVASSPHAPAEPPALGSRGAARQPPLTPPGGHRRGAGHRGDGAAGAGSVPRGQRRLRGLTGRVRILKGAP